LLAASRGLPDDHTMQNESAARAVALITGVGRRSGIGAAIAQRLADDGWDVATTYWSPYDDRMPWGRDADDSGAILTSGGRTVRIEADLEDATTAARVFNEVEERLGPVTALVLCHAESVDSDILNTTVDSFNRHFAVNARASWLLVAEHGRRYRGASGAGRIVALTSDHTVGNLPYGASKGALDRIVLAAAREFAHLRITANVINPGPINTGWMTPQQVEHVIARNPRGRAGQPSDTAALVAFLCSPDGEWINGQLLHSDGGLEA